ncbi:MAG: hypothetical protein JWN80_3163 [Microbacteriaceae bacterium]|nr:hypothetical protein [Microbacteriaceae bacterium]
MLESFLLIFALWAGFFIFVVEVFVAEFIGAVPTGEAVGRALSSPVLCMLVPAELPADWAIAPALKRRASNSAENLVARIILTSWICARNCAPNSVYLTVVRL